MSTKVRLNEALVTTPLAGVVREKPEHKKHKGIRILGITLIVLVGFPWLASLNDDARSPTKSDTPATRVEKEPNEVPQEVLRKRYSGTYRAGDGTEMQLFRSGIFRYEGYSQLGDDLGWGVYDGKIEVTTFMGASGSMTDDVYDIRKGGDVLVLTTAKTGGWKSRGTRFINVGKD